MTPKKTPRDREAVRRAARSAARSLWHTESEPAEERNPVVLLTKQVWLWLVNYVKVVLRPRRPFRTYSRPPQERPGMIRMPATCTVALASDWGSGTESAYRVADHIRQANPDITIHLGDVYYSGTKREFRDYFLGADDWPRGKLKTFTLNANHEMYSGGEGYFDLALPEFGQETSYFCLENDNWRILGVDTGYYSRTFPFLELVMRGWIRLHRENRRWMEQVVFADKADRRPVILLSHHQWFSAFDSEYKRIGRHVSPYLDRVLIWLWGHEHRLAGYGPASLDGAPQMRARCIGHGGMPIELGEKPKRDRNLVFFDERRATQLDGEPIGYCGFALLRLDGPVLRLTYSDEHGTKLLEEEWVSKPEGPAGKILFGAPDLTLAASKRFDDLT